MTDTLQIQAKWSGRSESFSVDRSRTVGQLIDQCKEVFGMGTCKVIGLAKGKMPEPEVVLSTLHPAGATVKLMLIGVAREGMTALGEQESLYVVQRMQEEARAAAEARERAAYEAAAAARREVAQAEEAVRAREREEARRVQHAEWEARRREEEATRLERELAAEQDSQNVLSMELQAFHAPQLDASGKILLPPHVLQDIINAKIQFPLTFQVLRPEHMQAVAVETSAAQEAQAAAAAAAASAAAASSAAAAAAAASSTAMDETAGLSLASQATSAPLPHPSAAAAATAVPILSPLVAYTGVQDFTAPPHTVSVPLSLLRALHVTDGAKLRLTNVNLQKASHIVLRPLTRAWSKLPELERRALLEFQLRKHTFLVQDSLISFSYHPHLPSFAFRVVETKPAVVVSITDTELSTEILAFEPEQDASSSSSAAAAATNMSDQQGAASSVSASSASAMAAPAAASSSSAAAASVVDQELPKLTADEAVQGKLRANTLARFTFDVTDPNSTIRIDVKSLVGDVDLYVLHSAEMESEVDIAFWTWAAQTKGAKTLTLSAADPLFQTDMWQIGLRAYATDAEFSITVHEQPNEQKQAGYQLGSSASSSSAASSSSSSSSAAAAASTAAPPADATLCPTCKSLISSKSLQLHSMQCARLNWICPQCNLVVKTNERAKHIELVHSSYTCLCGVKLEQAAMVAHRRETCSLRLVGCMYCPLKLVASERGAHQFECGTLRSLCNLCANHIQRKMMRRHLVKAHGGINGKTDERDITWNDFWA